MKSICRATNCTDEEWARGYCSKHYNKWRAQGATGKQCTVDECNNNSIAKGYCGKHYKQYQRFGKIISSKENADSQQ